MSTNVDFSGRRAAANTANGVDRTERPKAKFWINVGNSVTVKDEQGVDVERFVSLPVGIPLDSQDRLKIVGRNAEFNALQTARNDLLDQLLAYAEQLQPGEERTLKLELQLRRVNDDAVPVSGANNPFIRKLTF